MHWGKENVGTRKSNSTVYQQMLPDLGEQYLDRLPINFEKYELNDYRRVRVIGEDNEEVMKDWLDRGAEEVKTLEDNEILK